MMGFLRALGWQHAGRPKLRLGRVLKQKWVLAAVFLLGKHCVGAFEGVQFPCADKINSLKLTWLRGCVTF